MRYPIERIIQCILEKSGGRTVAEFSQDVVASSLARQGHHQRKIQLQDCINANKRNSYKRYPSLKKWP